MGFYLLRFTLDTNCLLDIDLNREAAKFVLMLVEKHRAGRADVAFVAVSASERQPGDVYLETYEDFHARLVKVGVEDLPQINGLAYFNLSYFDHALFGGHDSLHREREIHQTLFPNIDFDLVDYLETVKPLTEEDKIRYRRKWRNAWCDRQMIWSHEHHNRDVFVTSDQNFAKRLTGRAGFMHLKICSPKQAVQLL